MNQNSNNNYTFFKVPDNQTSNIEDIIVEKKKCEIGKYSDVIFLSFFYLFHKAMMI